VNDSRTAERSAVASNEKEFVALLQPVLPAAFRLAVGLLRSPAAADDAVQEAVLKAWRNFGRFRQGADLKPWLFTIVANECRRQQQTRWSKVIELPGTLEDPAGDHSLDAETADLRLALYRLPHDMRLVVVLRYYLDLSFEEVGQTLGVSTKAAKSRIYRALERLRLSPEVLSND
jgi:RNA polymerase sigma-70 factor (ECF subfamily)